MIASFTPRLGLSTLALVGLTALAGVSINASTAEEAHKIPAPALDEPAPAAGSEIAVVAGGCFWGVQGVFQHVDGVVSAVSGYDGRRRVDRALRHDQPGRHGPRRIGADHL